MATAPAATAPPPDEAETDSAMFELARTLRDQVEHRRPSPLEPRSRDDGLLRWALADDAIAVQLLRFVEALPSLRDYRQVARHLASLTAEVRRQDPDAPSLGLDTGEKVGLLGRAVAYNARRNVTRMADRFLAGESSDEIAATLTQLRGQGLVGTLLASDRPTRTPADADAVVDRLTTLLADLGEPASAWPDDAILDRTGRSPLPRLHVTVRVSSLIPNAASQPLAIDRDAAIDRLRRVLGAAAEHDAYFQLAAETRRLTPLVLKTLAAALDGLDDPPQIGLVAQACYVDAIEQCDRLLELAASQPAIRGIRLHEGAFRRSEAAEAMRQSRPSPVSLRQPETDARFETLTRTLLAADGITPTIATPDLRQLVVAIQTADELGVADHDFELEMRRGVADDLARVLASRGHRVRLAMPYGDRVRGLASLARMLLTDPPSRLPLLDDPDNDADDPSEDADGASDPESRLKELLMSPAALLDACPPVRERPLPSDRETFVNEPRVDWSDEASREAMLDALDYVTSELGGEYPLVIDNKAMDGRSTLISRNPSNKKEVVGKVAAASPDQAREAVESAARAHETWSRRTVDERAEYLEVIAAELRNRRFELAGWLACECGLTWADADAEVCDAIDGCRFFAREARRLDAVEAVDLAGEENETEYRSRGVAVVVASWRRPLAGLAGMAAAALATGNTVVMNPPEQASVVAAKLLQMMRDSGLPGGVVNYVPGDDSVAAMLVGHPQTAIVAFHGSRETASRLSVAAAGEGETIRRFVAQIDGAGAMLVDADADIDEAAAAIVESAMARNGQAVDGCGRVVVLKSVRDALATRLTELIGQFTPAAATEAGTTLGPVASEAVYDRVSKAIKDAGDEIEFVVKGKNTKAAGFFVAPHLAVDVPGEHFLASASLPGPLIVLQTARTLDDAIAMMNAGPERAVAGVISRSPETLARVRREVRAGTITLNQPTAGLLVARQPFGGAAPSSDGVRSGGSDYLRQFVVPITVTANVARRGYLPVD